ncbi:MAG: protein translocase subunit SecD [Acetobacteraceae bacterium]|nr:protein translocase subunit SecD [Acetobacteraceae bacterium]
MQQRSVAFLLVIVILVAAAVYCFLFPNPLAQKPIYSYINLGLDLRGGTHVVLEAQETPETPVTDDAMRQALSIIRFRVDKLGVSEPIIQRQGDRRIIVELAGIKDPEEAVKMVGKTAMLEFKDEAGKVIITGRDLVKAEAVIDPMNQPVVVLTLKPEAKKAFSEATTANVGKPIMIYLDEELVQAPRVQEAGIEEPQITGYEKLEEAQRVAVLLNSGALPVPLKVVENRIISATLGRDSIQASKVAAVAGCAAVALFMLAFYRFPGVIAVFALLVYVLLLMGSLAGIKAALTLPGIAGIVLSVGMAVDANVLIYERIKEEVRSGKTLRAAVDAGFRNALRAIVDSNVTTLIGAGVLFYFGAGPIRGFAVTLSLGIVMSMITAVLFTRVMLRLLMSSGVIRTARVFTRVPGGERA